MVRWFVELMEQGLDLGDARWEVGRWVEDTQEDEITWVLSPGG